MSTFKGIVKEFPNIRIDYFRRDDIHPPPLACFLSHVHSDHLLGLESLKSPFIYCSPATREILLRLEKYPARMNFAKGILETRTQTYKHLKHILKTIPLETPTVIELSPGQNIRVTLFDANHCIGSVMFFIEGNGKAILYTGDVRAESWWVSSLVRNPIFIPYTCGLKRMDNIYLDTTFATTSRLYETFPSKSAGIEELLQKIQMYPKETVFYFQAWTFGYEDVWLALSSFLKSRIHVDTYRSRIYTSVHSINHCKESPQLSGYSLGNHFISGCLTKDENVRIHSCERGVECPVIMNNERIVQILPIVTRDERGQNVLELGAGGGKGDLNQVQEVEMHDTDVLENLIMLCTSKVQDQDTLQRIKRLVTACHQSRTAKMSLETFIDPDETQETEGSDIRLDRVIDELEKMVQEQKDFKLVHSDKSLPTTITFPYSRHSSYFELCEFVSAFRPKELFPCTVDYADWTLDVSMASLFGEHCAPGATFQHDEEMYQRYKSESNTQSICTDRHQLTQTQTTEDNASSPLHTSNLIENLEETNDALQPLRTSFMGISQRVIDMPSDISPSAQHFLETGMKRKVSPMTDLQSELAETQPIKRNKNIRQLPYEAAGINPDHQYGKSLSGLVCTREDEIGKDLLSSTTDPNLLLVTEFDPEANAQPKSTQNKSIRQWAYEAATGLNSDCPSWEAFGGLICTRGSDASFEAQSESD